MNAFSLPYDLDPRNRSHNCINNSQNPRISHLHRKYVDKNFKQDQHPSKSAK